MSRLWEDDEREEEQPYLERGEACAIGEPLEVEDYHCPRCGKLLFRATKGSDAWIIVYCKRCHREMPVSVRTRQKIGF